MHTKHYTVLYRTMRTSEITVLTNVAAMNSKDVENRHTHADGTRMRTLELMIHGHSTDVLYQFTYRP